MKSQLITGSADYKKYKEKNYYLGAFCVSNHLKYKPGILNKKNTLFFDDTADVKNYRYLKKISQEIFIYLAKKLNEIHNCNKNLKYWRIIIYPWICYYVATLHDRWKIISKIEKNKKKYWVKKYILDKKFLEIESTMDWLKKTQNDKFNNDIFNRIIEFKKLNKIKQIPEKNKILIENKKKKFFLFFEKIFFFINYFFLNFNKIYFDKALIGKKEFIKVCYKLKIFQIKNNTIFDNLDFKVNIDIAKRQKIISKKKKRF